MKRNIGKNISQSLRQVKEDMQELQRLITHRSVYAKQYAIKRRPKHRNRFMREMYEL